MSPSELRTLSCAFDPSCTSIVACADYALALLHCKRAASGRAAELLLAAAHAEQAAHWLGGASVAAVATEIRRVMRRAQAGVAGAQFDLALARLEQALQALGRELEARGAKADQ